MDLKTSDYHLHHLHVHPKGVGLRKDNPFDDSFPDSVCDLNLKETTDLVKLFPMAKSNAVEAPPTPGRPISSFSVGSRKNFPSKWDDAQKWLISGPESPAHGFVKSPDYVSKHSGSNGFVVKSQGNHHKTEEKVSKAISVFQVPATVSVAQDHHHHHQHDHKSHNGVSTSDSCDVLLKDKFTNTEEANFSRFKCMVPIKEGFLFSSMKDASTEVVHETNYTTPGCPTPFKSLSPPRHNTPAIMSGPLTLMNAGSSFDIAELQECHLAKLQQETTPSDCNWSSREEEEEDVSKSLRHFEMNNECPKPSIPEPNNPKPCAWEEEEKTKSHLRYQREEAKIQAWVNLQNAKAEAQSRKLEVKIQKMRSKFEEKMMNRMAIVHRKAEELRVAAGYEHNMQLRKATMRSKKSKDLHESMHSDGSCGCFPCTTSNLHP